MEIPRPSVLQLFTMRDMPPTLHSLQEQTKSIKIDIFLYFHLQVRQSLDVLLLPIKLKVGMRNEMCWHFESSQGSIADSVGMRQFMSLPVYFYKKYVMHRKRGWRMP